MKKLFLFFLISQAAFAGDPAYKAMVVCAHPEASKIGLQVMKEGGNAVDAAIAVQFALAVAYPNAGNIGGGGFMVLRMNDGRTDALDFREKAPLAATRDMYLDSAKNVVENLSMRGGLASGVPGTVDGMFEAHKKYGKLPFEKLIQPAINLAENGFPITKSQEVEFNSLQEELKKYNPKNKYLIKKGGWKFGDTLVQTDLARTLRLIRDRGRDGFYRGETADRIINTLMPQGNILTGEDFASYRSVWRTPVTGYYRKYKFISMPPPSSGGIALYQLFKMLEQYDLKKLGHNSPEYIHLLAEAERRVYADRSEYLGDPDFFNVPQKQLLDSIYIIGRMKDFSASTATSSDAVKPGTLVAKKESEETTHFSVVDSAGNAVAVTTTLNDSYGSKIFVNGTGFLMNNEMDDFSVKPGVPNAYGLTGGEGNAIGPGKRMLSSMTPTILEKDGKLFMVVGTPGGATIITSVLQTILDVTDFGMTMQQAVDAGRFHHQWKPDLVDIEKYRFSSECISKVEQMGYKINTRSSIGRVDAILVNPNGTLQGGADPRGDDCRMGY